MTAPGELIAVGPPPLTQNAADCALDVIDFMAAVVRGVDLIDVTPTMREAWRAHLAAYYPMLAPVDRYWFASAPFTLSNIQATWQQLPELSREIYRRSWALTVPTMLQFIDPVLRVSHQEAAPQSVAHLVKSAVGEQQRQVSQVATADPDLQAQQELFNHHVNAITLQRFSNIAATNTIDLMHAMSGRRF